MRVLVTGSAGFVGSAVVDQLVERGHEVIGLDVLHPAAHAHPPDYLHPGARHVRADVTDREVVDSLLPGVDAVCHQAAMVGLGVDFADAPAYVRDNDLGTAVLLAALHDARFRGRVVLASSMVVYGEGRYRCLQHGEVRPGPRRVEDLAAGRWEPPCPVCGAALHDDRVDEHAPLDPRNVYAATKAHQEQLLACFVREHEAVGAVALRYHNVYGPRMPFATPYAGVASIFRSALEQGRAPEVFEDGGQRRDFVHVSDVARANVLALEATTEGFQPLNVASGAPRTVLDLARELSTRLDPSLVPRVTARFRVGDVRHVVASPEAAARVLGFRAEVPFAVGVAEFATAPLRGGRGPDPVVPPAGVAGYTRLFPAECGGVRSVPEERGSHRG